MREKERENREGERNGEEREREMREGVRVGVEAVKGERKR